MEIQNVSELISKQALENPNKSSICFPQRISKTKYAYSHYTFNQLEQRINQFANKLQSLGVKPGDKVLFFVKPNLDFCAITFALFRMGAISVFIDPGMKKKYFLECIEDLKPAVMVGIPAVHILSCFFKKTFKSLRLKISTIIGLPFLAKSLHSGLELESKEFKTYAPKAEDLAAILYTSGGTGKPKGVEYTHEIFINQTKMLQQQFNLTNEDIDIPGFPLFSFFTLAMGMKSVIPDMNFAKPNQADPRKLYQNIIDSKATFVAGSPAIWIRLAYYCDQYKLQLPSVKYMVMFGAPVDNEIHEIFKRVLPNGTSFTPYGATECLPVCNISGRDILLETAALTGNGAGVCVGHPFENVEIKIIKASDKALLTIEELAVTEIGEIIVHSKNVTRGYYQNPAATKKAKIEIDGKLWHRMGDMGYLDDQNRLWFCGRQKHSFKHRDQYVYPVPVEQMINTHPEIKRSALVLNHSKNRVVLVLEPCDKKVKVAELISKVKNIIGKNKKLSIIDDIIMRSSLPVDIRHNIKIDRILISKEVTESL